MVKANAVPLPLETQAATIISTVVDLYMKIYRYMKSNIKYRPPAGALGKINDV